MTAQAEAMGLMHAFNKEPSVVLHVNPGSLNDNEAAYSSLQQHPDIIFVLHILPSKNSNEYSRRLRMRFVCPSSIRFVSPFVGWMKSLSQRYGLIRQGVLLENAENCAKLPLPYSIDILEQYQLQTSARWKRT